MTDQVPKTIYINNQRLYRKKVFVGKWVLGTVTLGNILLTLGSEETKLRSNLACGKRGTNNIDNNVPEDVVNGIKNGIRLIKC